MATAFSKAIYHDPRWLALRLAKLIAENWRCQICGHWANQVHHVVPLHADGPEFPPLDGLRVLCPSCHYGAHESARRTAWRKLLSKVRTDAPVN